MSYKHYLTFPLLLYSMMHTNLMQSNSFSTVCDKRYAVGLSSGLEGSIEGLDDDAVYDLFIMMHELGHSLGSGKSLARCAFYVSYWS